MKQSMRHLTFLLLAMLSTMQTWAAPELIPSITGGSLAFYSEEACTTRLDAAAISSLTAGTTVYFKVKTDGLHTTAVTAADFTVEVGSGTGAAESRRSIDIGTDPTVTIEATTTPGVFSFSVLDAKIVIRATLPERTDTGISVNYIDAEGHEATATGVYVLDGSEDMLGANDTTTWFVCQTPVSPEHPDGFVFDHQLTLRGDVNVIIADGAKITVNSPDGYGIYNNDGTIGFYGQSTDDSQGQLSVTGPDYDGICAGSYNSSCDVTISSLKVVIEGKKKGVYASNNITVWGGEMTVTSDEDKAFLGSKGVSITGISKLSAQSATDRGVSSYGDITIVGGSDGAVVNVNDETDSNETAIFANGNISITGISKLTAGNARSNYGIYANDTVTIEGGEVTVRSKYYAIYGYSGVSITDISKLSAQSATNYGIYSSQGDVTIVGGSDGAVVNVNDETDSNEIAIFAYQANISITGISKLTVGNARSNRGIYANLGAVTIEGGEVTVKGTSEAIYGYYGVSITDISKLSAQSADGYGIYCSYGDVTIVGGSDGAVVNVNDETDSDETAIYADGNTSITGISKLTVGNARSNYGIYANRGAVTIEGSEVTMRSKYYAIYGYSGVSITGIGKLSAQSADYYGIYSSYGDVTIVGGSDGAVVNVNDETASTYTAIYADANISITGISQLTVGNARSSSGMYANRGAVTIEGGEVTVKGTSEAIYGYYGVSITDISKLTAQSANNNGIYSSYGDVTIVGGSNGAVVNVNDETASTYTAIYADANISITGISQLTAGNARSSSGMYASDTLTIEGGEVTVKGTSEAIYGYYGVSITDISKLTAQSANNNGIYSSYGDITIVGGSNGAVVNVNDETASDYTAIYANGNISITGISQLTVGNARSNRGIYASDTVTIEGGEVTVMATSTAIYGYDGITLSLTDETGFIYASSYYDTVDIADGQTFYDEEGNTYTGTIDDNGDIAGKTLRLLGNGKSCASVTFAPAGFCTYYNMQCDVELPKGVKARIVTATGDSEGTLVYETIADGDTDNNIVPAGTAMMLQTTQSEGDQQKALILMAHGDASPEAPSVNLLHGSDDEGLTTGNGKHYKLTYGSNDTEKAEVFGWYWGAADGAAFNQAAHRAWLVLPFNQAGARSYFGLPDGETTSVQNAECIMLNEAGAWYTLNGVKLSGKPAQKGVYICGGKKVTVK